VKGNGAEASVSAGDLIPPAEQHFNDKKRKIKEK
jgi:hypothetical protein